MTTPAGFTHDGERIRNIGAGSTYYVGFTLPPFTLHGVMLQGYHSGDGEVWFVAVADAPAK